MYALRQGQEDTQVQMILHYPMYYKKFRCIGGACEATCCTGWQISIDRRSLRRYKRAKGVFGRRLRDAVDFKNHCFKTQNGFCPMLDAKGLCGIYSVMGKHSMCRTCREYPRHMEDYGVLREYMLSLSCPEAAWLILGSREVFKLYSRRQKHGGLFWRVRIRALSEALEPVLAQRERMLSALYDRKLPFFKRLKRLLYIASDIPLKAVENEHGQESPVVPDSWVDLLFSLEPVTDAWLPFLKRSMSTLRSDKNTPERLVCFARNCARRMFMYENLAAHYLYMYFAGIIYGGTAVRPVKLVIFNVLVLYRLHYAQWLEGRSGLEGLVSAAWIYARQVDHWDTNLYAIEALLDTHPSFSRKNLEKLL